MSDESLAELLSKHHVDDQTAQKIQAKIHGVDLTNLVNSLSNPDHKQAVEQANAILIRYGTTIREAAMSDRLFKMYNGGRKLEAKPHDVLQPLDHLVPVAESQNPGDHLLALEGYNYQTTVDHRLSEELIDWLEQNKVDFLTNGDGHFHIKCEDRDHAYKVGRTISGLMRRERYVRDSTNAKGQNPVSEKDEAKRREREAKKGLSTFSPRDPNASAAMLRNAGPMDWKRGKEQDDKWGRGAKHKSRNDEKIGAPVRVAEGVIGFTKIDPLFRLRELAGLPPAPIEPNSADLAGAHKLDGPSEFELSNGPASPIDVTDVAFADASDAASEIPSSLPDEVPDDAGNHDIGVDSHEITVVPDQQSNSSPAMNAIDDHLNNVQRQIPDIKMSEYKILIRKLQDLTTQLSSMGRDYLGEKRRMKPDSIA
jgi:hypothetical protein